MTENLYLKHIESCPSLIKEVFPKINAEAARIAHEVADWPLQFVYLYGSGDSLAAATGATSAFMELCKLPTFALPSMQASRYAPGYCMPQPKTVLAIGLSNSGRVIRGLEATTALSNAGYCPILITSNPEGPSGKAAGMVFHAPVPSIDPICLPGVRSFVVAQLSLYLLAVHLAGEKGCISASEVQELVDTLAKSQDQLKEVLELNRDKLDRFGALCAKEKRVEFLASGPSRGASDFGVAKTLEATGYTALSPDMEEFSHGGFFALRPEHIPTVLICSDDSRCLIRTLEIEESTIHQGRPYVVITDSSRFRAPEEQVIRVPFSLTEKFAPLTFSFLTACLTAYMPLEEGDIYLHDHKGPFFEEGFPTIMTSQIVL